MIQMRIKQESELYNMLDPTWSRLSDNAYNYLKSFCTEPESKKHTFDKLQIISDIPIDPIKFQKAVRDSVRREQEVFESQIETNKTRAIWGYIVGVILSVAGFWIASFTDKVLLALVSFFGTMVLKEAITIGTKINPDIRRLKDRLNPLLNCTVEVIMNNENPEA